jgi:hypothetical protein
MVIGAAGIAVGALAHAAAISVVITTMKRINLSMTLARMV